MSASASTLDRDPQDEGYKEKDLDLEQNSLPVISPNEVSRDRNEVFWDEPVDQDPTNPMNWPEGRKWANIATVSAICFIVPLGSSMFTPGVPEVMQQFDETSQELASFVVSIYVLGFALGPLFLAPLSEMYGRVPVYHVTNVFFIAFTVVCAKSTSMGMLIAFRLLAGSVGAAPITIGAGTIADLMPPHKRASALALFVIGPLLGPVIGPIAGGFLVADKGWRWVFWLLSILAGTITVISVFTLKETYAPVILERKAANLRKTTGNPAMYSKLSSGLPGKEMFRKSIVRPMKLLFRSPIVFLLSLYTALSYGVLYLLFTTFTFVFKGQYHFSTSIVGLSYIGMGVGFMFTTFVNGIASDRIVKNIIANKGTPQPEDRLNYWLTLPGAFLLPIGLFIYGWTADKGVHWIVPIMSTSLIGAGIMGCMFCVQNYLVDAFTTYAASAMAANTVLRSIFGAVLPIAGLRMNSSLGLGWSNSLLAFVALAMIPVPVLFKIKGERIRTNPRFQVAL